MSPQVVKKIEIEEEKKKDVTELNFYENEAFDKETERVKPVQEMKGLDKVSKEFSKNYNKLTKKIPKSKIK